MGVEREAALELAYEVAYARLDVAEDFGWNFGGMVWLLIWCSSHTWWIGIPIGVAVYFLLRWPYLRAYERAGARLEQARKAIQTP